MNEAHHSFETLYEPLPPFDYLPHDHHPRGPLTSLTKRPSLVKGPPSPPSKTTTTTTQTPPSAPPPRDKYYYYLPKRLLLWPSLKPPPLQSPSKTTPDTPESGRDGPIASPVFVLHASRIHFKDRKKSLKMTHEDRVVFAA